MNTLHSDTASHLWGDKRYYSLNYDLRKTFGEKVYRLSLDGGMTCPNRDGTLSSLGCSFCSAGGSGDFAASRTLSVTKQLEEAKTRIEKKTGCTKFIAYFQAYTNTYAPLSKLRALYTEALSHPQVCALSIGTRSDCLSDEVIDLLAELSETKPVWVELGLQTIHNETLMQLNTHTTVEQFDDAVIRLSARNIPVTAHLIFGLPGETKEMMLASVDHLAHTNIRGIKLQLLHILKGTALAEQYEKTPFPLFTLEEYCDLIVDSIERLPETVVIHRITGDGPRALLLAPLWSTDKKRVLNTIQKRFLERDTWQGKYFCKKEPS